ncbi:uncharacterized protein I303_103374 [Kwoniella dejecticola CBS 10117]|uniref:Phytocyanin domain-containing protein n=1 Tax=Kwoniella dejecticola CBS 10117 TaxID=1296121 RepID=A0A1A6A6K1_9TREE|nr:uncharacterized protein I303_03397 [Kwoniella dejecticola CBS 10117]OBR85686.1 hypothetical protein I303_03397 [Kwoniella dejecticola CBS 10117]
MIGSRLLALLPLLPFALGVPNKRTDQASPYGSDWSSSSSDSSKWSDSSYDSGSSNSYDSGNYNSYDSGNSWESGNSYDSGSGEWSGSGGHATTIKHETTITTKLSYETPKYGSGSQWGGDLQSCLNMCQAQFGGESAMTIATATSTAAAESTSATKTESGSGSGTTHTVVVAPTKGVLRFVPFAIEGKEGDSVEFVWGAGPHSATLSDGQNVCNKSTTADAFDSGKLNATATFSTTIKGSAPQFHYCTVGNHCTSGMFGIINPPNNSIPPAAAANASSSSSVEASKTTSAKPSSTAGDGKGVGGCESVDCWVSSWEASGAAPKATAAAVKQACQGTDGAWAWGGKWDMSTLLSGDIKREAIVENILYSRLMIAMNPTMLVAGSPMNNFTAPPPLNEFVAAAVPAADSSDAPATISAGAEGASNTATTSSGADSASKEAASAGTGTSGASRSAVTLGSISLSVVGVIASMLLL